MQVIANVLKEARWIKNAGHSYACLMIPVPYKLKQHIQDIGNSIDKEILSGNGLEKFTHITFLYGLQNDDGEKIKVDGPIEIQNKPVIEYFDNKDSGQSVAIVKIESKDLEKKHYELKSSIPNEDSFPEYIPHITIAYLKYGERLPSDIKVPVVKWKANDFIFGEKNESQKFLKMI